MATEKFQQIVWQVIKGCPGAYNLHNDLQVVGADDKEHDKNLDRVMRKLEESGLTLNYDKCDIGVSSMVYMGDIQSNREVERGNETILKIVHIARLEEKDWRTALENFVFQYRVTPHTVTGVSPAELLMRRKLRDKLPRVEFSKDHATEAYWQQLLRERHSCKTPQERICGQNTRSQAQRY